MFDLRVERDGSRGPVRRLRAAAVVAEVPQRVQEEAGVRLQQEAPCLLQRPHGAGGGRREAQGEQARHRRDRGVRRRQAADDKVPPRAGPLSTADRRAAPRAGHLRVDGLPLGGRRLRRDDRPRPEAQGRLWEEPRGTAQAAAQGPRRQLRAAHAPTRCRSCRGRAPSCAADSGSRHPRRCCSPCSRTTPARSWTRSASRSSDATSSA